MSDSRPHYEQTRATCGARLPTGDLCRLPPLLDPRTGLPRNGRCRMHGGASTGARTPEGRARQLAALALANARRFGVAAPLALHDGPEIES
jgi:hypothetical protein